MNWNWKEFNKQKHLFKSYYCADCQQQRSCGILDEEKKYCCACYRKILEELEWERLLVSSAQQLLNDYRQRVIICQCWGGDKVRVEYLNSDGSGWSRCERCEKFISSAGHHRVVRNRNDPRFWGIESEWKILCLKCIGRKFYRSMVGWQRKKYREYIRRGYF
jgi:hypothetical protein